MLAASTSGASYSRAASKGLRAKAKQEEVVDDWEAELDQEQPEPRVGGASSPERKAAPILSRPAAGDAGRGEDPWEGAGQRLAGMSIADRDTNAAREDPRTVWEAANRSAPSSMPILLRPGGSSSSSRPGTLPSSILPPSLSSSTTSTSVLPSAPPPRILSRPKDGASDLDAKTAAEAALAERERQRKTLKEREEEYRRARARIFGEEADAAEDGAGVGAGSGTTSGRGSPSGANPTRGGTKGRGGQGSQKGASGKRGGGGAGRGRSSAGNSGASSPAPNPDGRTIGRPKA